jgi:hypothetical protein
MSTQVKPELVHSFDDIAGRQFAQLDWKEKTDVLQLCLGMYLVGLVTPPPDLAMYLGHLSAAIQARLDCGKDRAGAICQGVMRGIVSRGWTVVATNSGTIGKPIRWAMVDKHFEPEVIVEALEKRPWQKN